MRLTNSSPVLVRPPAAPPAGTNDLRPIKPPVEIPSGWEWLWWTLAALALVAALFFLWRWWRRKLAAPPVIPVIPPHVRARQRLQEALRLLADPRLFCIAVSDALRVYLEERFELRAPERTTEEFLVDLQTASHLDEAQKRSLADFLERCDLVKFARFEPTESALRDLQESALRLVDETRFEPAGVEPAPAGQEAAP
jgi:hypothetical protein